jgi:MFS family permease
MSDVSNPEGTQDRRDPTDELADRLRQSAFGTVTPGQTPTAADIWSAVGGVRGLIEAVVPGLTFLTVFSLTGVLLWSVLAPLALAVVFVLARILSRSTVQPALVGMGGIAASAAVALWSGRPEDNFVLGLWINGIGLGVMLLSIAVGRPLIGVISGLLVSDPQWRADRAKRTLATIATALWVGLFGARLVVQVPLFLQGAVADLAIARLVMGVPLYALVLWLSWLLMRSVYRAREGQQ